MAEHERLPWEPTSADAVRPGDFVRLERGEVWRVDVVHEPFDDDGRSFELVRWRDLDVNEDSAFDVLRPSWSRGGETR